MLRVLLQKANDNNPTVAANVLMCLGELACVGAEDAMPHVPDLMQVIISRLSDPSLIKRDAALHTLGQVCSSTGYVITPLIDYPQLLPLLGRILRTEISPAVRREVVKVLGILGALDPYRRKVHFSGKDFGYLYLIVMCYTEQTGRRCCERNSCGGRKSGPRLTACSYICVG